MSYTNLIIMPVKKPRMVEEKFLSPTVPLETTTTIIGTTQP